MFKKIKSQFKMVWGCIKQEWERAPLTTACSLGSLSVILLYMAFFMTEAFLFSLMILVFLLITAAMLTKLDDKS